MFVMVTKFVMITNSLGIIIRERNIEKTMTFPLKSNHAKAKAENMTTIIIRPVVITVNIRVFRKYLARGTAVKA